MKNYLLILFIVSISFCNAQTGTEFEYDNFENQFLSYEPKQNAQISKKDFDYASMIVKETKSATKNNPENFNLADYFNILSAFLTLKESEKNIKIAFEKFKNAEGSCEYMLSFENSIKTNPKYDVIRADYLNKLKECTSKSTLEKKFIIDEYCTLNSLNIDLVKKINQVNIDDQKYRNQSSRELLDKQKKLDIKNQKIINALYKEHKTYLGKSLVGENFESVMWAVIQHSNTEMMSEYLPIIHKAVKEKELDETPLKMMIDRYYGLTFGYQIFGSQGGFGFELAGEKKRKEIKLKYGIE
ncbi:hypothetical protein [Aureibaculum luteum]|uniref:hypothetical protein n=1 Tax=Aureibaculum luteum TaxID=1548456 RepID=UPI000E4BAB41|nr:hypothetical protein [Aureibaculum luteum]